MTFPVGQFTIVYADPPWSYNDKSLHSGGAERHYRTMDVADICALPVGNIADDNAALFMWVTFPQLAAWGNEVESLEANTA